MNENATANERCVKCGGRDIGVSFHGANQFNLTACLIAVPPSWFTREKGEHLHYACQRCGWDWVRAPLDAAPVNVTEATP